MLHLISQSPLEKVVLERVTQGDVVVFLDGAVFDILQRGRFADLLSEKLSDVTICAISEDLSVRGLQIEELVPKIKLIDYKQLVRLTVENSLIVSWS